MTRATMILVLSAVAFAQQSAGSASWLDRPLANWNTSVSLPAAIGDGAQRDGLRTHCQIPPAKTNGHRAVEQAGWIAYDHLDRALAQGDVEIVAGMTDADGACRPGGFQAFVFVGDAFAGTLSPEPMTTGQDASAGAVRVLGADTISAEFARYGNKDAPCCPTARMTVRYRIDRTGSRPLLVPLDVRTTRSH